jgi:hypothetical protein
MAFPAALQYIMRLTIDYRVQEIRLHIKQLNIQYVLQQANSRHHNILTTFNKTAVF